MKRNKGNKVQCSERSKHRIQKSIEKTEKGHLVWRIKGNWEIEEKQGFQQETSVTRLVACMQANDKKFAIENKAERSQERSQRDGFLGRSFGSKSSIYFVC